MIEESILASLAAACHLLISSSSTAQARTLQDFVMEESETKEEGGKKKFSNLSCYKTEKKGPQLCLLNKPFRHSLEELWQSSQ